MPRHHTNIQDPPMTAAIFDTLAFAKKLKAAGVPDNQAEVHAEAIAEIIETKLATKNYLKALRMEFKRDMQALAYQLTIRLGSMMILGITVLSVLVKIL